MNKVFFPPFFLSSIFSFFQYSISWKKGTLTFIICLLFQIPLFGQTPCDINGMAGIYPCNDYDLMSNIPISVLATSVGTPEGSDIWGWTDSLDGKEYAIVGTTNSTAFVDISDPVNPVFLGRIEKATNETGQSFWRDVKIYNNYAFIVADGAANAGHGMQIFDLTQLRTGPNPDLTYTSAANDGNVQNFTGDNGISIGKCHNIVINESKATAYLVGCGGAASGGPIFVDISSPMSPTVSGSYSEKGYTHDAQVITYNGPDASYLGREILAASNGPLGIGIDKIVLLDVTDKNNPTFVSEITYANAGYAHQGWFTEDHRYFIFGDETDEQNFGSNTKTFVFDMLDLDNPVLSSIYTAEFDAIDHNGYVKGDRFFLANYRAGMRVLDITNIGAATNSMTEVGYFDTYPGNNSTAFNGAWSVYPFFPSGNIVISDIERGLFVVRKSSATPPVPTCTDGVQNGTETGIDCGGSCSPCQIGEPDYCSSNGNNTNDEYISKVQLGAINNASGVGTTSTGYSDFTSISTSLSKGVSSTITVTPTWTGTKYNEGYGVFIDYNKDGDFTDSGETVWTKAASQTTPVVGTFTVPVSAISGTTRMRVMMRYNVTPTSACGSFNYGEVEDYTVNIGGAVIDTTAPVISLVGSSTINLNIGETYTEQGATATDNVDGNVTSNIVTTGTVNTAVASTYIINYNVSDAAGNAATQVSREIIVVATPPVTYCNSNGNNTNDEYISKVELGTINNTSGVGTTSTGYSNFTSISTSLTKGTSSTITITPTWTGTKYNEGYGVFIDYNQDGDFSDSGEIVWTKARSQEVPVSGSFTVPTNAIDGVTRMRVVMRYNVTPTSACGSFNYGEVEDYSVNIEMATINTLVIEERKVVEISLYPNPVKGNTLFVKSNMKNLSFTVVNVIGQQVGRGISSSGIDVSNLQAGIYMIQFNVNDKLETRKFIKQ